MDNGCHDHYYTNQSALIRQQHFNHELFHGTEVVVRSPYNYRHLRIEFTITRGVRHVFPDNTVLVLRLRQNQQSCVCRWSRVLQEYISKEELLHIRTTIDDLYASSHGRCETVFIMGILLTAWIVLVSVGRNQHVFFNLRFHNFVFQEQ
jgi:hypothetical protein